MTELERAKELGQAALADPRGEPPPDRRPQRLSVPDGDTGTNLTLTARAIMEVLEASTAEDRATLAKELTRAALMGARGNSGVIFSQILRGAAEALGEAGRLDAATIRACVPRRKRRRVPGRPQAGRGDDADGDPRARRGGRGPANAALEPAGFLKRLVERGEDALARTPDQLDVLKEAGVVDAGGAGLLEIVRGVSAALAGEPIPDAPAEDAHEAGVDAVHQELSEFRYCTVFVVEGEALDAEALEAQLERAGRLAARGRRPDRAEDPRSHRRARPRARARHRARHRRGGRDREHAPADRAALGADPRAGPRSRPTLETGVVAVVPGAGNRRLFESYGAAQGDRGRPDDEPVDGRHRRRDRGDARDRGARAAEQRERDPLRRAGREARDKPVRVIPSRSVPAGLAAIVRYLPSLAAEENEAAMLEALDQVATGEVTVASRDVELDGVAVRKGACLGLADGAAVASSADFDEVAWPSSERCSGTGARC